VLINAGIGRMSRSWGEPDTPGWRNDVNDLILANAVCCPEIAGGGADAIRSNERREFITLLGGVAAGGACYVEK